MQPLEMTSPRPSVDAPPSKPSETRPVERRARREERSERNRFGDGTTFRGLDIEDFGARPCLRGSDWFDLLVRTSRARTANSAPFHRHSAGPGHSAARSNLTVATSSDAGVTPLKDITQPAVVSPEARPIDLNAGVSLNNPPPSADLGPIATAAAQPAADASAGKPLAESVNTPTAAAPIAASPPTASAALDSKPVPVPTVPLSPDQTQIAAPTPSATNPGVAAHASDAPLPPVRPAPKAAIEAAGVAERSTPKLELPTKLSSKSAAHVVVAKADAAGHGAPTETASEPLRLGAPVNPEKGAKTLNATQSPAEAQAAPSQQPAPAKQSNPNPVVHAFNSMVGALTGLIPFVPH